MYPFLRLPWQFFLHRNAPPLGILGTHVSRHICWPVDLDPWNELNNGRTLTLFDMGRIPLARRTGLFAALRCKGWGLTVAGSMVRYRRRVQVFDRLVMRSRCVTWDKRFFYLEQSLWKADGDCSAHAIYRMAITSRAGIVDPALVVAELGHGGPAPVMPAAIALWVRAEDARVWPPMADA